MTHVKRIHTAVALLVIPALAASAAVDQGRLEQRKSGVVRASLQKRGHPADVQTLLDASSRVLVLEPGLLVKAVVPCDNPKWVEYTRKVYAELLAERAD